MAQLDEREAAAVRKVLRSGKLFRHGLKGHGECERFEAEFARKLGVKEALLVTSGTGALAAALGACGVGPGDEVVVPAFTFVATPLAVAGVGAVPVVANVDESLTLCPKDLQRRITSRTRAVIAVHMDGLSCDMTAILRLARASGLRVIEDAAQALGGSYRGRRLGSWGDFGCFSFNQDKILTCGEGGAVVGSDRRLFDRAVCMHDGAAAFTTPRWRGRKTGAPFLGGAMRMSEISGAILRVQLPRLDGILDRFRARKKLWLGALAGAGDWRVVSSRDPSGDCGTSVHLAFASPENGQRAAAALRVLGLGAATLTERPGHAVWQWMDYFTTGRAAHHPRLDPFTLARLRPSYRLDDYLETLLHATRTVRIGMDPTLSLTMTRSLAERARTRLQRL